MKARKAIARRYAPWALAGGVLACSNWKAAYKPFGELRILGQLRFAPLGAKQWPAKAGQRRQAKGRFIHRLNRSARARLFSF